MKKFLSFILAALLLFSMIPAAAADGTAEETPLSFESCMDLAAPRPLVGILTGAPSADAVPMSVDLEQAISNIDVLSILEGIQGMMNGASGVPAEEVRRQLKSIASQYNVQLTDEQIDQLLSLSESMGDIDPEMLKQRIEDIQNTIHKVSDAKDKVVSFMQKIGGAVDSIREFFGRIKDMLGI